VGGNDRVGVALGVEVAVCACVLFTAAWLCDDSPHADRAAAAVIAIAHAATIADR
jgi:hypothetical protein